MYLFGKVTVIPKVPERIDRLEDLAYNLWWSWNTDALKLFKLIDIELWNQCNKSPVKFINNVEQSKLEAAAKNEEFLSQYDLILSKFDSYMNEAKTWFSKTYPHSCATVCNWWFSKSGNTFRDAVSVQRNEYSG